MGINLLITDFFPKKGPGYDVNMPFIKYLVEKYGATIRTLTECKESLEKSKKDHSVLPIIPDIHLCSYFGPERQEAFSLFPSPRTRVLFISTENLLIGHQRQIGRCQNFEHVDFFLNTNLILMEEADKVAYFPPYTKQFYFPYGSYHYDVVSEWNNRRKLLIESENPEAATLMDKHIANKRKFCAFVSRHGVYGEGSKLREIMMEKVYAYKKVDCAGTFRNNMFGYIVPEDGFLDWIGKYKFMICFENSRGPGYITEKILQVYLAGTIPIYWGHRDTTMRMFNPKAMIYVDSYDDALKEIIRLDNDPIAYRQMLNENLFLIDPNDPDSPFNCAQLYILLDHIVSSVWKGDISADTLKQT